MPTTNENTRCHRPTNQRLAAAGAPRKSALFQYTFPLHNTNVTIKPRAVSARSKQGRYFPASHRRQR